MTGLILIFYPVHPVIPSEKAFIMYALHTNTRSLRIELDILRLGGNGMSIDLSPLIVEHVIIHEIMRQNLRLEKRPPIYSEIESSLDNDMKRYIKDKIVNSVGSTNSGEVVFIENAISPVPQHIRNLLSEETPNLVQYSKAIADYLNRIQSGRSPAGLVTIVLGSINDNRVIGVLKLEKEEGAS